MGLIGLSILAKTGDAVLKVITPAFLTITVDKISDKPVPLYLHCMKFVRKYYLFSFYQRFLVTLMLS